MEQKTYAWKRNVCGFSANMVGKEFEAIEHEQGTLTKKAIVDRARPEEAPMHKMFEWNDEVAGELYRREQAGGYIRCLAVRIEPVGESSGKVQHGQNKETLIRAYVNTTPIQEGALESEGRFVNVGTVLQNPTTYSVVLERAKRELQTFRAKYSRFEELRPVFNAIDVVEQAI